MTTNNLNIVFFGAPEFAAESLRALLASRHKVTAAVSQPDRPKGRSGKPVPTPVSALARECGIPVFLPEKVKNKDFTAELEALGADIFVVAAYGQFLNRKLLEMPRFGAVNVHASLLPKYRGASPVQTAILNGDKITGISIMQMERGMDTGDVLYTEQMQIERDDTYGSLIEKLGLLGGKALLSALDLISGGKAVPVPQNGSEATYAPLLTREMGIIDFNARAEDIYNKVRAFDPWPGAAADFGGKTLKIWKTAIPPAEAGVNITCGDGETITLLEVQAAGGKRMHVSEFLKGQRDFFAT